MSDFKNLVVFQKAYVLTLETHQISVGIRGAEYISLKSQLIRAANSIPANIVEGRGQESQKEFARYLRIAINSAEITFAVPPHPVSRQPPSPRAGRISSTQ